VATYNPQCTDNVADFNDIANSNSSVNNFRDPFHASTIPFIYVVGATTVIAWTLLIMVMITPGASRVLTKSASGPLWSQTRRIISTVTGGASRHERGSRPFLQKVAAMFVAIALTVVTADALMISRTQYYDGFIDASALHNHVTGSLEIRVLRVVTDVFVWFAQVQTLLRLFDRDRERVAIKCIATLLVVLDTTFSCLNSFWINSGNSPRNSPRTFQDAIPALSYLFQLSLNLLYTAWVFYYVATKRRYAFYHPKMPNICIIALLSTLSVLIPTTFFVADITNPSVGRWGDYFRWIGAAAASIIVWDWVERIEALEDDERKDSILGREIFDDHMKDGTSSNIRRRFDGLSGSILSVNDKLGKQNSGFGSIQLGNIAYRLVGSKAHRTRIGDIDPPCGRRVPSAYRRFRGETETQTPSPTDVCALSTPSTAISPTDRQHINSGQSSLSDAHHHHHHPVSDTPPLRNLHFQNGAAEMEAGHLHAMAGDPDPDEEIDAITDNASLSACHDSSQFHSSNTQPEPRWTFVVNAFKRKRQSPPLEVKNAVLSHDVVQHATARSRQDLKATSSAVTVDRNWRRTKRRSSILPQEPTVIPAPPRGLTWSPAISQHSPVGILQTRPSVRHRHGHNDSSGHFINSTTLPGSDEQTVERLEVSANNSLVNAQPQRTVASPATLAVPQGGGEECNQDDMIHMASHNAGSRSIRFLEVKRATDA